MFPGNQKINVASISFYLVGIYIVFLWIAPTNADAAPLPKNTKYCTALDECWPSQDEFSSLNKTIDGNLVAAFPPAWPCHDPHYDEAQCNIVKQNWENTTWRALQPAGYQDTFWEANCSIDTPREQPCVTPHTPHVTAFVQNVDHIKESVKFARENRLRLRIKGASHDYIGRSAGEGSFLISTIHLKGPQMHQDFVPDQCTDKIPEPVLTVPAGSAFQEAYSVANASGRVIVGGSSPSVGMSGGWITGGGHSALSYLYGLGADNVVQFEVVTADGEYITVTECSHPDLFWALRGGGGGFAVIVSATFKTYPNTPVYFGALTITSKDLEAHKLAVKTMLSVQNEILDAGISAQAYLPNTNKTSGPYTITDYLVIGDPKFNETEALKSVEPLLQLADQGVNATITGAWMPQFIDIFKLLATRIDGGFSYQLASRLVHGDVFYDEQKISQMTDVVTAPGVESNLLLISGGKVLEYAPDSAAVSPEWRSSILHAIVGTTLKDGASKDLRDYARQFVVDKAAEIGEITGSKGSYINEDSADAPNRDQLWWGSNYDRLALIKKQYDPKGVFTCHGCLGDENGY